MHSCQSVRVVGGVSWYAMRPLSALQARHLSRKAGGLGSSRADGVLLLGTTMGPAKRLVSEAEAESWLDGIIAIYTQPVRNTFVIASHNSRDVEPPPPRG
ncbi:hypothetical protein C8J57DRAFT_1286365 [Mycena rebaudengoi]|nr:hypothetical protein C8J57DRAFT_1286365 [Mycena rebaudengoi]